VNRVDPAPHAAERLRWAAGIVNHASYDDLAECLASLAGQTLPPEGVVVVDTGVDPARLDELRAAHPAVWFEQHPNRGWGAGVNRALAWMRERHPETELALLLNPDVSLDADYADVLADAISRNAAVAVATGKLLRPGRQELDSAGIRLPRHRRPRDRGSGEPDTGAFDRTEYVFGASGAAMLVRRDVMEAVAIDGEIFDEDFFAYHDDTDLCWRVHRFGWKVLYEPRARAVHGRRWRPERRFAVDPAVRRHSFKNHYLQLVKNERGVDFVRNLPWIAVWEVARLGFVLLFDRALLPAYAEALRAAPRAWAKRRALAQRLAAVALPAPGAPAATNR
jgi:GT2 family glycosyltransferase